MRCGTVTRLAGLHPAKLVQNHPGCLFSLDVRVPAANALLLSESWVTETVRYCPCSGSSKAKAAGISNAIHRTVFFLGRKSFFNGEVRVIMRKPSDRGADRDPG